DSSTGKLEATLRTHKGKVLRLAYAPHGKLLATSGSDALVRLWHSDSGKERATLKGHGGEVHGLAFSPDGKFLASGCRGKSVTRNGKVVPDQPSKVLLWDVDRAALVHTLPRLVGKGQADPVSLAFHPDGGSLAYNQDESIRVWDVRTRKEL